MLTIDLLQEEPSAISAAQFETHLTKVLEQFGPQDAVVEILVVGDERMRVLNRAARGKDSTTDVLSLPTAIDTERGSVVPVSDAPRLLGTIVICLPEVRRKLQRGESIFDSTVYSPKPGRRRGGDPLDEEILELAAHSLRHLLGHDHDDEGEWTHPQ